MCKRCLPVFTQSSCGRPWSWHGADWQGGLIPVLALLSIPQAMYFSVSRHQSQTVAGGLYTVNATNASVQRTNGGQAKGANYSWGNKFDAPA